MPDTAPGFIVHQGNQSQDILPRFLDDVSAAMHPGRVGATVFIPRYQPSTVAAIAESFEPTAAFVIADPETHRMELPFDERGRGRRHHAYLQESDPIANRARFVSNVMSSQVEAGRGLVISPWLTHGTDALGRHLRATVRFAHESMNHLPGQGRLLIGAAATEAVIADDEARSDFLDELVELPEAPIYFRMLVTPPESFTQYRNDLVLLGMRHFVSALVENGRWVLLPQTGLAGWLMMAHGATAFGSGINASLQRFGSSSGFGLPLEWYFLPQLLGFVLRDEVTMISSANGFEPCDCPYCGALDFAGSASWDRNTAGLHYLWWCARLANTRNDVTGVQQQLADALEFWTAVQAASVVLDPRSEPRHLEVWTQIVA